MVSATKSPAAPRVLPLPSHYAPGQVADWSYRADQAALFQAAVAWRRQHGVSLAATDKKTVHFLLIDCQKDFCLPDGTLYVGGRSGRGAIEDSRRICEFLYRNLPHIRQTTVTLDSHLPIQIFFAAFWENQDGSPADAFRTVGYDDIASGRLVPVKSVAWNVCGGNYEWLKNQVLHYTRELEKAGKYQLYLWPPHCLLGEAGHALVGAIHAARLFHGYVREVQPLVEIKGANVLTENYSVLRPEVLTRFDNAPLASKNTVFLKTLLQADAVVIAGQAASHCVKSSIADLLQEIAAQDISLARKVYILEDCMSAVAVPDGKGGFLADFTVQAQASLDEFRNAGMRLVKSTDPIESWPGLSLG